MEEERELELIRSGQLSIQEDGSNVSAGLALIESIPALPYKESRYYAKLEKPTDVWKILDSEDSKMEASAPEDNDGDPAGGEEEECCAICLCELDSDEPVKELNCTHCFHSECLDEWLRLKVLCPLCKQTAAPPSTPLPSAGTREQPPPTRESSSSSSSSSSSAEVGPTAATATAELPQAPDSAVLREQRAAARRRRFEREESDVEIGGAFINYTEEQEEQAEAKNDDLDNYYIHVGPTHLIDGVDDMTDTRDSRPTTAPSSQHHRVSVTSGDQVTISVTTMSSVPPSTRSSRSSSSPSSSDSSATVWLGTSLDGAEATLVEGPGEGEEESPD